MAYFPNGSDGLDYQEAYCNRCVHDENNDCPIWNLHLMYNGEEEYQPLLDALIPPIDEITIGECKFFTLSADLVRGQRADQLYFQWQRQQVANSATTPEESKPRRPQARKTQGGQKIAMTDPSDEEKTVFELIDEFKGFVSDAMVTGEGPLAEASCEELEAIDNFLRALRRACLRVSETP